MLRPCATTPLDLTSTCEYYIVVCMSVQNDCCPFNNVCGDLITFTFCIISIYYNRLLNTTFEKDFPDIVTARATAKSDKLAKMREKMKIDLIAEQRTYNLMTQVLDDLVHQKRGKRIAFGRWLDCVGMIEQSNNVTNYRIQFKPGINKGMYDTLTINI